MNHVAVGLSRNPSLTPQELLLYLHATLAPYVTALVRRQIRRRKAHGELINVSNQGNDDDDDDDDQDDDDPWGDSLPSYLEEESSDDDEKAYTVTKRRIIRPAIKVRSVAGIAKMM